MNTIQRVRMTHHDYTRLHDELAAHRSRRGIEVPDDFMDYDASRVARHSARQARIREIEDLLSNAVVVGAEAVFDPVAEPGMVLTVRYDDTGDTETFLLGRSDVDDAGIKVYSMASPLGRMIAGARPGDQRVYAIPGEAGRLVTLLKAVPCGIYVAKRHGPQSFSRIYRDCSMGT
ncbi:transcription elongation factor GreA [Mycobacterium sp. IS-2888]|uniref:GreA/GreB family elongation factor n=1 Tax=Mycobacterium sp. IS-2888 TaxID=1834159 RepID=UPI00096DF656|nr:GreA/GreB family elongation factor [Mycobacterium sp. IS-2888]OMC45576.1 transcription elongation factor GreA [Mycobacterium sp. IS-2888]